ncbi:hypothetical protein [Paracoccus luteus]|uniref:hypothetical protein n=1 Tax=Paracoccus luteus TaxID=2508543 RepID=UPI00106FBC92|nr:hypothetical protein [Paracoccus luteus]
MTMTAVEQRRFFARLLSNHAEEWAEQWASGSQDGRGGTPEPVAHPAAVSALRRAYAAMLRRGGMDYVERITMEEARAFPGFAEAAPESACAAWLAVGLKDGDLPRFAMFIAAPAAFEGLSEAAVNKEGRAAALWELSKHTKPD